MERLTFPAVASLALLAACPPKEAEQIPCAACGGECQQDVLPNRGADHLTGDLDYVDRPPASGDHSGCWARWGIYADPLPPENWVHNLEHGGVALLWNCPEGCAEDQAALESYAGTLPAGRVLVTPYADMDWTFAAVSWQNRLLLSCLDLEAIDAFFLDHVGQAPENLLDMPPAGCEDSDSGGGM